MLLKDFEVSIIDLFISSDSELTTYWIYIYIYIYTYSLVGRRKPLKKFTRSSLTDYSTVISDSIGFKNVEIIRITRAKVGFGLRFKNRLVKDLLLRRFIIFRKCNQALITCLKNFTVMFVQVFVYLRSEFV